MTNTPELHWKKQYTLQESGVSSVLQGWLMHPGSFMQRLKDHGAENSRIHVLSQEWQQPEAWENQLLHIEPSAETMVREVLILNENHCWMFARSVFPRETLTGEEAELANLQTRPLGSLLFNHPDMQRSEFAFACLQPEMAWYQKTIRSLEGFVDISEEYLQLWARYSLFRLHEKSLLLTEVFLPDLMQLT